MYPCAGLLRGAARHPTRSQPSQTQAKAISNRIRRLALSFSGTLEHGDKAATETINRCVIFSQDVRNPEGIVYPYAHKSRGIAIAPPTIEVAEAVESVLVFRVTQSNKEEVQ